MKTLGISYKGKTCWLVAVMLVLGGLAACNDGGTGSSGKAGQNNNQASGDSRVKLGRIRTVDAARVADPNQWDEQLDYDLEAEFWDIIGNSAHDTYPQWRDKVKPYLSDNENAPARLAMLVAAGGVFALSPTFQDPLLGGVGLIGDLQDINDAALSIDSAIVPLKDHEPAVVFYHNNKAMLSLLLGASLLEANGLCHLEQLRIMQDLNPNFFGTEGRAAAPFTYGMVNDNRFLDYGIELAEDCDSWICLWTSKLAPFKPIGELMMLGELHWIKSVTAATEVERAQSRQKYEEMFDRAEQFAIKRNWPYIERLAETKAELESRTSYGMHPLPLLLRARYPLPVYSNGVNCSTCHIGGEPGAFGQPLENPYLGHDNVTPIPEGPDFLPLTFALEDCGLD